MLTIYLLIIINVVIFSLDVFIDDEKYVAKLSGLLRFNKKTTKRIIRITKFIALTILLVFTIIISREEGKRNAKLSQTIDETNNIALQISKLDSSHKKLTDSIHTLALNINSLTDTNLNLAKSIHRIASNLKEETALTGEFIFDFENDTTIKGTTGVELHFGNSHIVYSIKKSNANLTFVINQDFNLYPNSGDTIPIKFELINSRLYMSFKLFDLDHNLIAEIDRNHWIRNPNFSPRFNYDNKGFEFFDNRGNIALNIEIEKPPVNYQNVIIKVQGYLYSDDRNLFFIKDEKTFKYDLTDKSTKDVIKYYDEIRSYNIFQLFEYTGTGWVHKRKKGREKYHW